jgi:guanylate kinase
MQRNSENNLIVISGPSGVGKDSVITKVRHLDSSLSLSVSATTRPPRDGEQSGSSYHFLSREVFEQKIQNSEFLEYTEYCGNYYGTFKRPIEKAIRSGRRIILKIDVQGAEKVRQIYPGCLSIFILPPSLESLQERILLRQLDDSESMQSRLAQAEEEISHSSSYDFSVVNDTVDACAHKVLNKIYGLEEDFE